MKTTSIKSISCIVLSTLLLYQGGLGAETEYNGAASAANRLTVTVPVYAATPTTTGFIDNNDDDWFYFTNDKCSTQIVITWRFEQADGDNGHTIRVYTGNPPFYSTVFTQNTSSGSPNTTTCTIDIPPPIVGKLYWIELDGNSVDGIKPYTLSVVGTGGSDEQIALAGWYYNYMTNAGYSNFAPAYYFYYWGGSEYIYWNCWGYPSRAIHQYYLGLAYWYYYYFTAYGQPDTAYNLYSYYLGLSNAYPY